MRENRTYGSEGGEVLTHLSDPIRVAAGLHRRDAFCGRPLAGDRCCDQGATAVGPDVLSRTSAPTNARMRIAAPQRSGSCSPP